MDRNAILVILLTGVVVLVIYWAYRRYRYLKTNIPETIKDRVVLRISVPIRNDKKALAAEQLFQSIHGSLKGKKKAQEHFSFEILGASHGIYFIAVCDSKYRKFVENQIYAQYPEAQIVQSHDYANIAGAKFVTGVELSLTKESYFPIRTFASFDVDPIASITSAMSNLKSDTEVWIQLLVRPIGDEWQINAAKLLESLKSPDQTQIINPLSAPEVDKKIKKQGFQSKIRIVVKGNLEGLVNQTRDDIEASFNQFQNSQINTLSSNRKKQKLSQKVTQNFKFAVLGKRLSDKLSLIEKYQHRFLNENEKDILNSEEVASIFHLPHESVKTPNISWAKSKKLEYPLNLPIVSEEKRDPNVRVFGFTDYRNIHLPFGIKNEDRRRHMYLVGKTGSGKSSYFLRTMIVGDILDGKGVCVLDPHGDLVEEILDLIPEYRLKDVVYLDPSDIEYPIGLNMLDIKPDETMDLLADGIVNVFKKFFDSWGPRLQYILQNTILTLLHCQNVSLLAVQRILTDKNYRKFLLKQVKDPFLIKFWEEEFAQFGQNQKLLAEAISPIQNKVGRFLSSPMVRNMIGQIKSSIDLAEIMNSGKILLVNLSQGKIGEENSSLLGGMLVTRLYTNAMQRARMDIGQRRDFYLYVDEFQNFATESFIKILSEARKYGLCLTVTHQYIDQIDEKIQDAIFGNIGTLMNYVVGQKDAQRLEREYAPHLNSEDLVNLDRFRVVLKMTIDGAQSPPFTAITMRQNFRNCGLKGDIKAYVREQYAKPREVIEQKLNKWAEQEYDGKGNLITK